MKSAGEKKEEEEVVEEADLFLQSCQKTSSREQLSRYSVGDQLGKGGFGVVYEVALKYVTKTRDTKCPSVPEIIRLLDWQDHPDHFVMVLECPSPCEDLVQFMKRHSGRLDEEKNRQIMRQATQAANMSCVRGVLNNLMIDRETSEVKLIDFGCGDMLRTSPYRSYSGTAVYSPPEYHERGMYYGRQATAWSLGVLMFAMLCRHYPSDYDLLLLKRKLWSKPGLSTECCHLLRALLQDKPSRRLGLGLILSHNWSLHKATPVGVSHGSLASCGLQWETLPSLLSPLRLAGRASLALRLAPWLEGAVFASGGTAPGGLGDASIPPLAFASCGASKPCVVSCALA
ncbi:hypothetical protein ABG768_026155 [Culter alburnus]|uniref:non-specific serine/threonine protein kinase n=1 Tax=Culter alburnus TaxID=194366 RepID=A0AAW2ACC6_CULAL